MPAEEYPEWSLQAPISTLELPRSYPCFKRFYWRCR